MLKSVSLMVYHLHLIRIIKDLHAERISESVSNQRKVGKLPYFFKHVDRPSSSNSAPSSKQPVQHTLDSAVDEAASIQNMEIR